ncbi:hypothetical protein ACFY71_40245 [Streptomyces cinerochromogenes]|uniref:hypothetical protein n=1 Tax=Streptomyces cinerochromogenes TaxID=66422 RepID=UPI0036821FE9
MGDASSVASCTGAVEGAVSGVPEVAGLGRDPPEVPLVGLPSGVDGVWVGFLVGVGFGNDEAFELVTVTVTGSPGPVVKVLVRV